eukprot:753382-Hanusia_phi.AAC.1
MVYRNLWEFPNISDKASPETPQPARGCKQGAGRAKQLERTRVRKGSRQRQRKGDQRRETERERQEKGEREENRWEERRRAERRGVDRMRGEERWGMGEERSGEMGDGG